MGDEERRLVLQMVAEGKITAEEGARLLEALAGGGKGGERREAGAGERVGERMEDLGKRIGERMEDVGERIGEHMEDMGERIGGKMAGMGAGIADGVMKLLEMFPWVGVEFSDSLTREGQFRGEGPWEVDVEFANGRLEVEGWDGPGWRLEVETRARGRETRNATDLVTVEAGDRSLKVRSARMFGGGYSVSGVVKLPPGEYVLRGTTSNGRMRARAIRCQVLDFDTSNGRIELDGVEGDRVELETSNGAIVARLSARKLVAVTSNGSIRVEPQDIEQDSYELRTSNGSIRLICPDREAGYRVDATTSLGGITVELPGLARQWAKGAAARATVKVATPGFEEKERRLDARLRTSNGSITVSTQGE